MQPAVQNCANPWLTHLEAGQHRSIVQRRLVTAQQIGHPPQPSLPHAQLGQAESNVAPLLQLLQGLAAQTL